MPRLKATAEIIRAAEIFEPLDVRLADPESLMRTQDPQAFIVNAHAWQRGMGKIWRRGEQKVLGAAMVNIGIPVGKAANAIMSVLEILPPELDRLIERAFNELKKQAKTLVVALAKKVLEAMLEAGMKFAAGLMSAIPIVGWVADIIIGVVKAVVSVFKLAKKLRQRERFLYERAGFSPDLDHLVANELCLEPIRNTKDWNNLFLPLSGRWGRVELKGGGYRYSAGWPWTPGQVNPGAIDRTSFVPGTNTVFRQWEITGPTGLLSTGNYLPSGREVCSSAWGLVNEPGPSMFCVRAGQVRQLWHLLLSNLHDYMETISREDAKLVRKMAKSQFGGDWSGSRELALRTAEPVKAAETLGTRQREAIQAAHDPQGPIWVAYVGEDYGAFPGSNTLKHELKSAHRAILQRRVLPQIDFDVIPDGEFRQALIDRVQLASTISTGALQKAEPKADPTPGLPSNIRSLATGPKTGNELVIIPENEVKPPRLTPVNKNPDPDAAGGGVAAALALLGLGGLAAWKYAR